jgi:DNA-binding MarR family transcriptional regulator
VSSDIPDRDSLIRTLDREMRRISAQSVMFSQAVAERLGLNPTDLECLGIIGETGALTAGQLAELTGLTTGAITGVIDRLERAGYVRRQQDPDDRRRVIVEPVPGVADEKITPLFESITKATTRLISRYTDNELALITEFATRMNQLGLEETAKLRAAEDGLGDGQFGAPLNGLTDGRLVFASGASNVAIRGDTSLTDLYRARFEGTSPTIQVQGNTVTIKHRNRPHFEWSMHSIGEIRVNVSLPWQLGWLMRTAGEVRLNTTIPWQIEIRAGASHVDVDLSAIKLQSLNVKGGASQVKVTLPTPSGTVPVRVGAGASQVTIHRPVGIPTRIHVHNGASQVRLDNQQFGALGGEMRWEGPDYEDATDRYDIEISGGASQLTVDTITATTV